MTRPPLTRGMSRWLTDEAQRAGEALADELLLVLAKEAEDAVDGLAGIDGVEEVE